jgi:hypothetical protein
MRKENKYTVSRNEDVKTLRQIYTIWQTRGTVMYDKSRVDNMG